MSNLARRQVTQAGDAGGDRRRGRGRGRGRGRDRAPAGGVGNGRAEATGAGRAPGVVGNGRAEATGAGRAPQISQRTITRVSNANNRRRVTRSTTQAAATNRETRTDGHRPSAAPRAPRTRRRRAEEEITEETTRRRSQRINARVENNMRTPAIAIRPSLSNLPDIDEGDIFNQLALAEYVKDIFGFYRNYESLSRILPIYPSRLRKLYSASAMRTIVFDWLLDIQMGYNLMPQTLFLSMNLLDRFFSVNVVGLSELKLVGVTTILLASKYEDIWPPEVNDLIQFVGGKFTIEEMTAKEEEILDHLDFILSVPTAYFYISRFLKAGACKIEVAEQFAFYLTELSIRDQSMLVYSPSFIAAAAVYTACSLLKNKLHWTSLLRAHTGYTALQLSGCAFSMVLLHRRAQEANSKICRKFDKPAFQRVSRLHFAHITRQFFVPQTR